jgi:hypothetical protein
VRTAADRRSTCRLGWMTRPLASRVETAETARQPARGKMWHLRHSGAPCILRTGSAPHDVVLRTVLGDVSAVECLTVLLSAEATSGA